jgi:hypothetical protein
MRVMGLHGAVYWSSHYITAFLKLAVLMLIIAVCMCNLHFERDGFNDGAYISGRSNTFLVFILLLFYANTIVWFAFAIAALMKTGRTSRFSHHFPPSCLGPRAAALCLVLWVITFIPYLIYYGSYDTISSTGKVFMSLALNSGMGIAMHILSQLESTGMLRSRIRCGH